MSGSRPLVSILVLSWNGRHHLESCLAAIRVQRDPGVPWEVLVLDNGSRDGTADWMRAEHPEIKLLTSDRNLGFCAGNNRLAEAAEGEALIFLNNDTRPAVDWLASLVDAYRSAAPDVAAIAGRIVDWEGERLDFGRGIWTFDAHAFQLDFHRPLATARTPASGDELPFPCGGNTLVRRRSFFDAGAFDERYFAYLEDVDLGWRLWAGGERVVACAEAVVAHRSAATSELLGVFHRGFLFERNALLTAFTNLDQEMGPLLLPAIWLTYLARIEALLVAGDPRAATLRTDPFRGALADTAESGRDPASTSIRRQTLSEKVEQHGVRELARRAVRRIGRRMAGWGEDAKRVESFRVDHPQAISHLRAASLFLQTLDECAERRARLRVRRRRPDREIFRRFPLYVVPTYPGDERLFRSAGFKALLPDDLPIVEARLDEIMEWSASGVRD